MGLEREESTSNEEDTLQPHDRNPAKESQIMLWLYKVLDEVTTHEFEFFIKDGSVLCRLMNKIKPGAIPEAEIKTSNVEEKRHNVQLLLKAMTDYGVTEKLLFQPDDLLFVHHVPRVTRCIFTLGKLAEQDKNYKGPGIGEEPTTNRRQSGMPIGDDIAVSHVDVGKLGRRVSTDKPLEKRRVSLINF